MRTLCVAAACALLLTAGSALRAADKNKDLIVGKWEAERNGAKIVVEFTKDGDMKMKVEKGGQTFDAAGKYKFIDDDNVELEMTAQGQTKKDKNKVAVTKDELTFTNAQGKEEKFKRVK